MKKLLPIIIVALNFLFFKVNGQNSFLLNKHDDHISFIRMDSVHSSQTTVIEYKDFLVLIELPLIDNGADKSTGLQEDKAKADRLIDFLNRSFNNKPVKYVLHSHWHLHSLSGISPFLKNGAKLVTTEKNWTYSLKNGLIDNATGQLSKDQIIKIKKDTTLLLKSNMPIELFFLDSSYTNKPTKEYLFFYLPNKKILHASCMCALEKVDFDKVKTFTYSNRLIDLNRLIKSRGIEVQEIIKLGRFEEAHGNYLAPVFTMDYLNTYFANGKSVSELVQIYTKLSADYIKLKTDSIQKEAVINRLSPGIFNQAVYDCIKVKEFKKALALAQLLNLYYPGEANFIDTLGEAYYLNGDVETAVFYEQILRKRDKNYSGGLKTWEENFKIKNY